MAQWLDYRVRVTINNERMMLGTFLAFDKYMNVVLADCEEFKRIKSKSGEEREIKRSMGLVLLRGEQIVSLTAEAPPAQTTKKAEIQAGPGKGQVAGRGMPIAPINAAPAGLGGAVRGIGGPSAEQMQPRIAGKGGPPAPPISGTASVRPPAAGPPKVGNTPKPPQ